MRLFLSSYRAGDYPEKLVELFGKKAKVAVITNAKDDKSHQERNEKYQAVWVAGGNTFVLRRALKYSKADRALGDMVRKNEVVYGGESAGAILPTPTLTGVEFGDDPGDVPKNYKKDAIWNGLNLISYHVVPHYESTWEGAQDMIRELQKQNLEYKTLTDSQALIINGDKEELLK
jgi:dipeptidase E